MKVIKRLIRLIDDYLLLIVFFGLGFMFGVLFTMFMDTMGW